MHRLATACEQVATTPKKLEKTGIVAGYLKSREIDEAALSAVFLSGRAFPLWEETTLQVGGSLLWRMVGELSGKSEAELRHAYAKLGDLGAVAGDLLASQKHLSELSILEVGRAFREIAAARGPSSKAALVRALLEKASPLEAKYIVKIMTGDLRIGLKESLVEEAIVKAYGGTLAEVQRANMLLGDIGQTLRFASEGKLAEAKMRLFHPLGFMLASPAESSADALCYFENALVEDKYDGIRAQAHCSGNEVRFFSRTRDEITESFPELPDTLAGLLQDTILDGEIVAWSYLTEVPPPSSAPVAGAFGPRASSSGTALPFSVLQRRLGRKKVSRDLQNKVPVAYLIFDVLYAGDKLLIDVPLGERGKILDQLLAAKKSSKASSPQIQGTLSFESDGTGSSAQALRASVFHASSPQELDQFFEAAQARGNEGLMIKDPTSAYTPGRRGKSWLKLKRELATLDVVVTAAEYGHGKRIGVLSDYTFAVRNGEKLVNIGKAYSGLTDIEIADMTKWFLEHTIEDQGFRRIVEPKIVLEVAFNNMMRSDRHESGYALRFPRIARLRPDKPPEDVDTIERAREIYEKQSKS
jgi:DNA ligase-1